MHLTPFDWVIIALSLGVTFVPAIVLARRAGRNITEFFAAGRQAPWWLIGISLVATTFSTDTPNLVTNLVRDGGVAENWVWWSFLLTGMATVFFYARLWRRSGCSPTWSSTNCATPGRGRILRPRLSRHLSRIVFQLRHHRERQPGGGEDRRRALRLAPAGDAARAGGRADRLCGNRGTVGRHGHRHDSVLHHDYVVVRGRVLRTARAGRRRTARFDRALQSCRPLACCRCCRISTTGRPRWRSSSFRSPYSGGRCGIRAPSREAAVTSRSACWPHAPSRDALFGTLAFQVMHYALRPWPWIVVALASIVVYPSLHDIATRVSIRAERLDRQRHRVSGDARLSAGRIRGLHGCRTFRRVPLDDRNASELGHVVPRSRFLPALLATRKRASAISSWRGASSRCC